MSENNSDGDHTFSELYDHRAALFCKLSSLLPDISWKSRKHWRDADEMFTGYFVAGVLLNNAGMITYHLEEKWWPIFKGEEVPNAPPWDGHTANDVIERLIKSIDEQH